MKTTNILLAGVGGQGIILSSHIIATAAEQSDMDVTTSEIHGMAQRGGSVTAQIRYGEKIISPLILEGEADVILASEPIEAIRYAHYLNKKGIAIVNSTPIIPFTVSSGLATYPKDVEDILHRHFPNLIYADYTQMADALGNKKMLNVIMLGTLAEHLKIAPNVWEEAIKLSLKEKLWAANIKAFATGRKVGTK